MIYGNHEIDHDKLVAYELSVAAEKLLAAGDMDAAQLKMGQAAALDKTYLIRAKLLVEVDSRKVQVNTTVKRILIPLFSEAGFGTQSGKRWTMGDGLNREQNGWYHSIHVGKGKFGKRLGILAAKWQNPAEVAYFNWCELGIRTDSLAYKTQQELEMVCQYWCQLCRDSLFPWFDNNAGTG